MRHDYTSFEFIGLNSRHLIFDIFTVFFKKFNYSSIACAKTVMHDLYHRWHYLHICYKCFPRTIKILKYYYTSKRPIFALHYFKWICCIFSANLEIKSTKISCLQLKSENIHQNLYIHICCNFLKQHGPTLWLLQFQIIFYTNQLS